MKIDIDNLNRHIAARTLKKRSWGYSQERACLVSALVPGAKSSADCAAQGWPLWLAELSVWLFDEFGDDDYIERGRALAQAIAESDQDWDRVYRDVRINAILPIVMRSIGHGNEDWRVECRSAVQWCIDNDGAPADITKYVLSCLPARAAWIFWTAEAETNAGASMSARAAGLALVQGELGAAKDADEWHTPVSVAMDSATASARDEICAALMDALNGGKR